MDLRGFQQDGKQIVINRLSSNRPDNALFVMPPGTGKTVLIVETLKEAFSRKLIKKSLIVVYNKVLQEFLKKSFLESGINNNSITILTSFFVKKMIDEQTISSNEFDLIVFDELEDQGDILIEIFNFFNGLKWGLSSSETGFLLEVFNKQLQDVDFRVTLDFKSGQLAEGEDYKQLLIHSIKASLINYGSNEIDHRYYNQEYNELLEFVKRKEISVEGIKNLVNKKQQLEIFKKLLTDDDYFNELLVNGKKPENVWQTFFEYNNWIFGLSFNFVFNAPLEGEKLEQVVEGYSIKGSGKRVDALLRTRGLISSFYFGEIKTHRKNLLKEHKTAYRPDSWMISEELSGAIAQLQKTIHKSIENIGNSLRTKNSDGFFSGETIYLIKPKSFLLIGSLNEFKFSNEIHEEKLISFELFRRSLNEIEIITFDELYERAVAVIG